ncbi:MAG: putative septum site-determining protein MinC [Candidatus Roseilinea sp.]|nr:MAG: putative septum site-determining protein MinC [Candidatus Roseilinea sp.]
MIAIKGFKHGLVVVFWGDSSNAPWPTRLRELEAKLSANPDFFKGGSIAFDVKATPLSEDDLRRSIALLQSYEVTLWAVLSEDEATRARVRALGLADRLIPSAPVPHQTREDTPLTAATSSSPPAAEPPPAHITPTEEGYVDGLLVRRRVRSGQVLRHPGHVVVIGDVNPGAQLIAGSDIIVWGKLQGSAHAGALGDDRAVICALEMSPSSIRIADVTHIPQPSQRRSRRKAGSVKMARIKDQEIVFVAWDGADRLLE